MKEWICLLNPAAGRHPMPPERVEAALSRHGVRGRVEVVDGADRMREAVVEVAIGGFPLAVVGGDGTAGLAADALVASDTLERLPLFGVLPAGTGCDLLRTFGIPQEIEGAAAHLAGDGVYWMDLGVVEGAWGRRCFVNEAQAGVGAAAAQTAPILSRRLGPGRYPLAFAARLPRFPRAHVTLSGAPGLEGDALAVVLANGQFFAGGWNIAPKAMLMDGELDLQVIYARKRDAAVLVPKIVKGVHLRERTVRRRSVSAVEISTDVPWPVEADGDYLGPTPITARTLRQVLPLKI